MVQYASMCTQEPECAHMHTVMSQAKVGVVHGPIRTKLGYHLILIEARSDSNPKPPPPAGKAETKKHK